jgi:hypothetical protein
MKRTLLALMLSFSAYGCAAMDGNFVGGTSKSTSTPAKEAMAYEPMGSMPPAARKEDVPELKANEVWVPGYYQPVAGAWLWHQGQIQEVKAGYKLMPAGYREEGGKVLFTPPRWRRADLVAAGEKKN